MRKFYLSFLAILAISFSHAQLTGIKTIPGDYATIALAINDLNTVGVGAGGVTFNVAAGHTESTTSGIMLTATGIAGNPIIFQKSGAGANPNISRTDAGTNTTTTIGAMGDGIIKINGSDYVTFDGIDVNASDQGIEYGYYIDKLSATNASQNVTIKNAKVTMTKGTSAYVIGINISNGSTSLSSATGVTVTAASGRSENITLTGNTIENVHTGIYCRGSSATGFYDQNFVIGATGAGNTIQNYGGGSNTTTYGIYFIYTENVVTNDNMISNAAAGGIPHGSTIYGIMYSTIIGSLESKNNNITLANSTTSGCHWIYNGSNTTTGTVISNNSFSGTITSTTTSYAIYNNNT
nr:hypothetical protein [Flavisolibacter sp.]